MMATAKQAELRHYVEQWGLLFESLGSTRMMGRILAWLLICDPPEQTAKEIADALDVSLASVSGATRALIQAGLIDRVGIPGKRSAHLRVRAGMWAELMRKRSAHLVSMKHLVEEGLSLLPASLGAEKTLRLREIRSYCEFWEREFPEFLARWEETWRKERS